MKIYHRYSGDLLLEVDASKGIDLSGKNLRYADLVGADLRCADLRNADLIYADLRGADLRGADLSTADLNSANLTRTYLSYANLCEAILYNADLRYSDLRNANLCGANLRNANLTDANLCCAELRYANLPDNFFYLRMYPFDIVGTPEVIWIGCEKVVITDNLRDDLMALKAKHCISDMRSDHIIVTVKQLIRHAKEGK